MIHRIGWACVTYGLGLSTNRTFRISSLSPQRFFETAERNIAELRAILDWMAPRGFRLFRIGQSFIPFASHPLVAGNPDYDWQTRFESDLAAIGKEYTAKGFRFSMHPGQYAVLNSPKPDVVQSAQAELTYSCNVLQLMGLNAEHKVVLHGGAAYGNPTASLARMQDAILALPEAERARLVLENDEKVYPIADIVALCENVGVPPVFDIFHHSIHPGDGNIDALLRRVQSLWETSPENGRPKVHLSSQMPDARTGKHDVFITPDDIDALCDALPFDADLMVEAKGKEEAASRVAKQLAATGCAAKGVGNIS